MKLILLFPLSNVINNFILAKKSNRSNPPFCCDQIRLTLSACQIPCLLLYFSLALCVIYTMCLLSKYFGGDFKIYYFYNVNII